MRHVQMLAQTALPPPYSLDYSFAQNQADVEASLALRHQVFVQEMGARIRSSPDGLETDALDDFCLHLLVRESATNRVVASTRILTHEAAIAAGGFYSATEFDIARILCWPGRFLEIGRTCVHPDYRRGAALATLWSGIGALVRADHYDYLIGCASIDLRAGLARAHAICQRLLAKQPITEAYRVLPLRALPPANCHVDYAVPMPPLIRLYLRLGAQIGGPPCHDPDFRVADVFMHLDLTHIAARYARHFIGRPSAQPPSQRIPA